MLLRKPVIQDFPKNNPDISMRKLSEEEDNIQCAN